MNKSFNKTFSDHVDNYMRVESQSCLLNNRFSPFKLTIESYITVSGIVYISEHLQKRKCNLGNNRLRLLNCKSKLNELKAFPLSRERLHIDYKRLQWQKHCLTGIVWVGCRTKELEGFIILRCQRTKHFSATKWHERCPQAEKISLNLPQKVK